MSSSTKTTNYELSQFLGTDKPAWLSDYNTDMSKIDTQMKANADAATAASGSATSANTAIGTLANLTTDVKTSAVAAINEVDAHADTASETAASALSTATSASTAISNLSTYLTMSSVTTYNTISQFQITAGGGTIASASMTVARNADGSLAKVYGVVAVTGTNASGDLSIKLNVDTGLRPSENISINACGICQGDNGAGLGSICTSTTLTINTDGTISLQGYHNLGTTVYLRQLGSLLFIQNFGDQPE